MSGDTDAPVDPTQPPRPTHTTRRVNALAARIGARRYLEIGVQRGHTFRTVEIAERVGVDPRFLFDTEAVADATTTLHAMTSDRFFAEAAGTKPFDIVFIDGLHVFEQVVRDLTNTLAWTGWHSAILIDDVMPTDVYSSIPVQRDALRFRREAGGRGGQWHGDVFKIAFLIHDFFPSLDYRTIVGTDNAQTLAWRAAGPMRKPIFNSLERISRLTWFDLQAHMPILRGVSEEEAIELCAAAIAPRIATAR
ncbi:class I SAM-dependent methyltransferase [Roseomonas rosulenta]|uniref:class I SAM-dependent methyltransferase n=1 Tax=Roseomonas rosulenta TaxID=2748667 RepID=UPI0018DF5B70|nr:class I SAM-dependent methyltransferase [Roseomonas rosulenta]